MKTHHHIRHVIAARIATTVAAEFRATGRYVDSVETDKFVKRTIEFDGDFLNVTGEELDTMIKTSRILICQIASLDDWNTIARQHVNDWNECIGFSGGFEVHVKTVSKGWWLFKKSKTIITYAGANRRQLMKDTQEGQLEHL